MIKRIPLFVILLISSMMVFVSGCTKTDKDTHSLVKYNVGKAPKTIDPQLSTSGNAANITNMCMQGLLINGQVEGEILPGVAKSWTVSKDGLVWNFKLRHNAKWSNGERVTAHDFNYALKRALEPATAAQNAYMLYNIKNSKEYNQGKIKDYSQVGVKVLHDYELEITLANPVPYFAQLITNSIALPLNEKFYKTVTSQYCLSADKMLFNGPYIIKDFIPNGKYTFEKNPHYWNELNISIKNINFLIVNNYNTAANMFKTQGLTMTKIKGPQLPQFKNSKELKITPNGGVAYLMLNTKSKYFKNANIRRAIGWAINRKAYCDNILKDGSEPAFAFVPPGISGGKVDGKLITFRKRYGMDLFNYDAIKAKVMYQKGLKELGIKNSDVKIKLLSSNDSSSMRNCQFIQQQLFQNIGLNIILEPNTWQGELSKVSQNDFDFCFTEWLPDYNDPATFLNLWVGGQRQNNTQWNNADYNKYIKLAKSTSDNNIRMKAMHNAEVILMADMPVIPLNFGVNCYLIQPWLEGVVLQSAATVLKFNWAHVKK